MRTKRVKELFTVKKEGRRLLLGLHWLPSKVCTVNSNRGWNFNELLRKKVIHLRLGWGSFHGSTCSNIKQVGLTWALFSFSIMCICSDGQRMMGSFDKQTNENWIEGLGLRSASGNRTSGLNIKYREWLKIPSPTISPRTLTVPIGNVMRHVQVYAFCVQADCGYFATFTLIAAQRQDSSIPAHSWSKLVFVTFHPLSKAGYVL